MFRCLVLAALYFVIASTYEKRTGIDPTTITFGSSMKREAAITYIKEKKQSNSSFTVIDLGGSYNAWSEPVADAYVDIKVPDFKKQNSTILYFALDLTDPETWGELLAYVAKHGKFSFSICSHTLEDISSPVLGIRLLQRVSEAGYIALPTKHIEMGRGLEGGRNVGVIYYRGFHHHRWIFDIRNNVLWCFPKLNFLDFMPVADLLGTTDWRWNDFNFIWYHEIKYQVLNDGYMGPSKGQVWSMFNRTLRGGDIELKYNVTYPFACWNTYKHHDDAANCRRLQRIPQRIDERMHLPNVPACPHAR